VHQGGLFGDCKFRGVVHVAHGGAVGQNAGFMIRDIPEEPIPTTPAQQAAEDRWVAGWLTGPTRLRYQVLPPQVGDAAPDLELPDITGRSRRMSEFWTDGPALFVFLRHFGCSCLSERWGTLREDLEVFAEAGAKPEPMPRLQLFLKGQRGSPTEDERYNLRTDADGNFRFPNIPPGPYMLTNRLAGQPIWRLRVELKPAEEKQLNLNPGNSVAVRDDFPEAR